MRVALIGAGAIAQRHVTVLERRDGVSVAAVCDTDGARASQLAARTGATAHTDWAAMLDGEALDAVFVCTPPGVHAPPAIAAFQRGLAVYLEKPLARDADDGAAIVDAWRSSGAVCARWLPVAEPGRRGGAARAARRGSARHAGQPQLRAHRERARRSAHGESWFTDQRRSGGILYELGSHDVDLQIAIAGPVEWVQGTASTGTLALAGVDGARLDDAVSVVMRFASGGIGSLHVAWTEVQDPAVYSLDVQAPDAALLLQLDPAFHLTGRAGGGSRQHRRGRSARVVGRPVPRGGARGRSVAGAVHPCGRAGHAAHAAGLRARDPDRRARSGRIVKSGLRSRSP